MFRIDIETPGLDTNVYYVINTETGVWIAEKKDYFNENNAKIIAYLEEIIFLCKDTVHIVIDSVKRNLQIAIDVDKNPGKVIVNKPVYLFNSFNLPNGVAKLIEDINNLIWNGKYCIRKKSIAKMRTNWINGHDFINDESCHSVTEIVSFGCISTTFANVNVRDRITYNYYSGYNMNLYNDNVLKNNFQAVDSFIQKSDPIFFVKDGYYLNNKVTITEPRFEYDDSDYFFDQQKESISKMEELEANNVFYIGDDGTMDGRSINRIAIKTNFGIISNDPGSGKTRCVLAVALRDICRARKVGFRYEAGLSLYVEDINAMHDDFDEYLRINNYDNIKTTDIWRNHEKKVYINKRDVSFVSNSATLIVVSNSIYTQWEDAIFEMIEEFDFDIYLLCLKGKPRNMEVTIPDGYDIILVTDNFYNKYMIKLNQNIMFNRIIFDEPDTIIFRLGEESCQARFKWLVSSTVVSKIKSHLNGSARVISYSRIGDIEASGMNFGDQKEIDFIMNKINIYIPTNAVDNTQYINFIEYKNFQDTYFIDTFRDSIIRINADLTEAIASGNEDEISRILGTSESNMCKLDRMYKKHFNDIEREQSLKVPNLNKIENFEEAILELDTKLVEMIKHKADTCPICLEDLEIDDAILYDCCFHMLHKNCTGLLHNSGIDSHLRCPLCRAMPAPIFNFIDTICYKQIKPNSNKKQERNKKQNVVKSKSDEILKVRNDVFDHIFSKEGTKTIVYATCNENGSVVDFIKNLGHKLNVLKGTVNQRKKIISEFKSGLVPILVLLNHKNVAGLNLTEATDLIVYNRTSDEILKQVIGRIDRHGLDHNVNVHLLDTSRSALSTIKEKYEECKMTLVDVSTGIKFSDIEL